MSAVTSDGTTLWDEEFKVVGLPEDLSQHEMGFCIDFHEFHWVHPDLGLEKVVSDESYAMTRGPDFCFQEVALAVWFLIKNRVRKPPRKIHVRRDYNSKTGPLGVVDTYKFVEGHRGRYGNYVNVPEERVHVPLTTF